MSFSKEERGILAKETGNAQKKYLEYFTISRSKKLT